MATQKQSNHTPYRKDLPLYIERILLEYTDDQNSMSVNEITKKLSECYGIEYSKDTVLRTLKAMQGGGYQKPNKECSASSSLNPRYCILNSSDAGKTTAANSKGLYYAKRLQTNQSYISHLVNLVKASSSYESSEVAIDGVLADSSVYERGRIENGGLSSGHKSIVDLETALVNAEDLTEAIKSNKAVSFGYLGNGKPSMEKIEYALPLYIGFDDGYYYLVILAKNFNNKSRVYQKRMLYRVLRVDWICPNTIECEVPSGDLKRSVAKAAKRLKEDYPHILEESDVRKQDDLVDVLRHGARWYFDCSVNRMPSVDIVEAVTLRCESKKPIGSIRNTFNGRLEELSMEGAEHPEYRVTNVSFDGMKKWALKWVADVEVVAPQELRDAIVKDIKQSAYAFAINNEHEHDSAKERVSSR